MKRFITELRRREVFRTAGLYVGICWIVIEVGSVLLPVFDAPEWLFRGMIIAAVAGFPIMLVLAWFFDVNEGGISLQGDVQDTAPEKMGARKSDFAIIGFLGVALVVSLYVNVSDQSPSDTVLEPVAVLISTFDGAASQPGLANVAEVALAVGIEVAPHVTVIQNAATPSREQALTIAQRDGIELLLAGSLTASGDGYRIGVEAIDVANGETRFSLDEKADSRSDLLEAISELATDARKKLGDKTKASETDEQAHRFTAASVEAAQAYATGKTLERAGKLTEAASAYAEATVADPNLGRAFAGLALVEFSLGQTDEAETHWAAAIGLAKTMTERERLHALGRYQSSVTMDDDAAAITYARLVDEYPADVGAREQYADVLRRQSNFTAAAEQARKILAVLPADNHYRSRLALYAMYAGDWETAKTEAEKVIAADPAYGAAYLPVAIAALGQGEFDAAREAYAAMASVGDTDGLSLIAELGLADADLFLGRYDAAEQRLEAGIKAAVDSGNNHLAALKTIALAQSYSEQENLSAAIAGASDASRLSDDIAVQVQAALIYIRNDDLTTANAISDALSARADSHSRAYGQMLSGLVLEREGNTTQAILAMRDATETADLWLIRYQTAMAYLRADNFLEALGELTTLQERRGEAAVAFFDGAPTYRLTSQLTLLKGEAQQALNMQSAARKSYEKFISLRPDDDVIAEDAKGRIANLK